MPSKYTVYCVTWGKVSVSQAKIDPSVKSVMDTPTPAEMYHPKTMTLEFVVNSKHLTFKRQINILIHEAIF